MADKNITIKSGETYVVTNDDRTFGTVTIQPGGNLKIETAAQVKIDKLVKE